MAALVVSVSVAKGLADPGTHIGIFPGGATPAMHAANTPFWIGYGFTAQPGSTAALDDGATRFELEVDGEPVPMVSEVRADAASEAHRTDIAVFPAGLPRGWHDFSGRWFDGGKLILSSRATIQFVEP